VLKLFGWYWIYQLKNVGLFHFGDDPDFTETFFIVHYVKFPK